MAAWAAVIVVVVPFAGGLAARALPLRAMRAIRALALACAAIALAAALFACGGIGTNETLAVPWIPAWGLSIGVRVDAAGALFALLVAAVGLAALVYAGPYLAHHLHGRPERERTFYAAMLAFGGAVAGAAYAPGPLLLYVFWELAGIPSYLLIGLDHDDPESRFAARRALIVTGAGGIALLAVAILLGPSFRFGATGAIPPPERAAPIAVLALVAAATKSAQFPFHAWLPRAMTAPTPVSAFLHSAALVALGVLLVLRLSPFLDGVLLWRAGLVAIGAGSMAVASVGALAAPRLKGLLAFSTIGQYGYLFWTAGVGGAAANGAVLAFFVAHALAKSGLFLVAGAITHATDRADLAALGGLARRMPGWLVAAAMLAATAAGVPATVGFAAKEGLLAVSRGAGPLPALAFTAASAFAAAYLIRFVARPFFSATRADIARRPGWPMLVPALGLSAAALVLGLFPAPLELAAGFHPTADWRDALLTAAALAMGAASLLVLPRIERAAARMRSWVDGEAAFDAARGGGRAVASMAIRLQSGDLRRYIAVTGIATAALTVTIALAEPARVPGALPPVSVAEAAVLALTVAAALMIAVSRRRVIAIVAQAASGYAFAALFAVSNAPDVALVIVHVETLATVLFVLAAARLRRIPALPSRAPPAQPRWRTPLIAGSAGLAGFLLAIAALTAAPRRPIASHYFEATRQMGAHDVVAAILVSFRGLDTFGEITVFALSATAVVAFSRIYARGTA